MVDERNIEQSEKPAVSSWFHRDQPSVSESKVTVVDEENVKNYKPPEEYDSNHRNPAYAGGEKASFVELIALKRHFHPTVSLFAQKILAGLCGCKCERDEHRVHFNRILLTFLFFRRKNSLYRRSVTRFHDFALPRTIFIQESETLANR